MNIPKSEDTQAPPAQTGPAGSQEDARKTPGDPPAPRGGVWGWAQAWWGWALSWLWYRCNPAPQLPPRALQRITDVETQVAAAAADMARYRPLHTLVTQFDEHMPELLSGQKQLLQSQLELYSEIMARGADQSEPTPELLALKETQATLLQAYRDLHTTMQDLVDRAGQCLELASCEHADHNMSSIVHRHLEAALLRVYVPLWPCDTLTCKILYTDRDDEEAVRPAAETLGLRGKELRAELPGYAMALVDVPARPPRGGSQFVVLMRAAQQLDTVQVVEVVERAQWLTARLRNTPTPRAVLPCVMSPHFTDRALQQVQADCVLALGHAGSSWPVPGAGDRDAEHPALRASAQWVDMPARV